MNNNPRSFSAAAAAVAVIGAATALAAPAHAASASVTVTCDNTSMAAQTVTPALLVGDTLTVTYNTTGTTNPCTVIAIVPAAGEDTSGTLALTPTSGTDARVDGTYFYPLTDTGTVVLRVDSEIAAGSVVVNLGSASGTSPNFYWGETTGYLILQGTQPAGGSGSADILQQVSVPTSGTCADIADDYARYGTDVSGGWTKSWAEWINNGLGGDVCTRTLEYSTSLGQWVVAA